MQSAIDEVNAGVGDLATALSSGYMLIEKKEETYAAQSGDSYSDMLDAVCAAMKTKLDALDDKTVIIPYVITISDTISMECRMAMYAKGDNFNLVSNAIAVYADQYSNWYSVGYSGSGTSLCFRATTLATGTTTCTNIGALTSTEGKSVTVTYYVLKKT